MDMVANAELKQFMLACDEFIKGKYIVADTKISAILKAIAYSEKIKNIISNCLFDFDFDKAFKLAAGSEDEVKFELPEEITKVVAFCFTILFKIDCKEINFYDFISKHFKQENEFSNKEFEAFSKKVVIPFKDAIEKLYTNTHILVDSEEYKNNIYNKIILQIKLIKKTLGQYKLKNINEEEFNILLDSFLSACDKNDKQQVFAFLIAVDYFTQTHKKCRPVFNKIQDCFK